MMRISRPRLTPPSWLRLPRRTARLRLTVLYGGLFLLCGTALLAITYLLVKHAIGQKPVIASVPGAPSPHPLPPQQLHQLQAGAARVARQQAAFLEQLLIQSGIALAIVAVAATVLGWLVASRVLRPLATITATAQRISATSLHERLALQGPDDELKDLGDTLDDLFARLEASFEAQRHFVANASHELRTPLTRERTLLQVTRADPTATTGTWQAVSRELLTSNAEQERLIEALLTLASSESGLDQSDPADLAAITSQVLAAPRPGIGRLGLHVQAATQPAIIDGDPLLVERLVANLIDNAVGHNIPGGRVQIATGTARGCAVLSVTSTGPIIPPAEVDRLFQPFQRLRQRRTRHGTGHGLGLSIVQAIATAHSAAITAHAQPDGGLAIDVTFPPALQPPIRTALLAKRRGLASRARDTQPVPARHNTTNRPCSPRHLR